MGGWGATACMGFVLFRSTLSNLTIQRFERATLELGDDQKGLNYMLNDSSIEWQGELPMPTIESNGRESQQSNFGIFGAGNGHNGSITLLPHSLFVRECNDVTVPHNKDTPPFVIHCMSRKKGEAKVAILRQIGLIQIRADWASVSFNGSRRKWLQEISVAHDI